MPRSSDSIFVRVGLPGVHAFSLRRAWAWSNVATSMIPSCSPEKISSPTLMRPLYIMLPSKLIDVTSSKGTAAVQLAILGGPSLVSPAELIEPPHQKDGCAF